MRINTRLRVAALAPLLMALIVGVTIWFAHGAMRTAQQRGRIAERIIRSMNDLHSLVGHYSLYHEERTRQQFLAEHDTIAPLLAAAGFDDPEQQRLLTALRENTDAIRDLFLRTVAIHERLPSSPETEALGRDENRLMGQLLVRSRQAVADGLRLDTLVDDEIVAMQSRTDILVIFPILIVTLLLTLLLTRMMSRIARGLATLRRGTQVVGGGNLAHRVGLSGEDELAGLAQAFDQMTENLQAVSVSRNELEGEVEVRKRAEEALRKSREDLDRAQEVGQIGWWRLDTQRNVLTWSDETHRIFGVPKGTPLTYETFLGIVHPDDRQYVTTQWNAGLRGEPYEIEHRIAVDGQIKWVREKAYLEFDDAGRLLGAFGISQDITDRKRAEEALRAGEEALRQANEHLEEKIRERTAELLALNRNLMESRDQLRSLASDLVLTEARERRALASELHDTVAQMLAIAKLTLEATGARLEGKSGEEVKRVVHLLQEAGRQTRSLMADLSPSLLYEAGLGQALRALARRMGELHSLAVEVVDDGNPKPLGEDYRVILFRAVQELLHNVVKHAKATQVKVSLQRDDEHVRIEVEDDGVGFLVSRQSRGDGMREGFGLFSIQERLRHLGGSFEVFSQPGRGVRAVLVAPLQGEGEGEGREPAAARILVAEDHGMMRDALASLLEKEPGFEVVGLAADGLEALRLAREVKPDVVLMDVQMPRMDGIEATRQIKADLPKIKVIGLSVQSEPQIASQMLAAGASSFVSKSSSPEELTEAIRTAVRPGKGN